MDTDDDEVIQYLDILTAAAEGEWRRHAISVPSVVYHYTSAAAFAAIIRSQRLWATAASQLNDATELLHAAAALRDVLRARAATAALPEYAVLYPPQAFHFDFARHDVMEVFVASLTSAEDDLAQWDRYADRGYGVAIGFDAQRLVALDAATHLRHHMGFVEVCYDQASQREFWDFVVQAWERLAAPAVARSRGRARNPLLYLASWFGNLGGCACAFLPRMKSSHFAIEREWRLIHAHVAGLPHDCAVLADHASKRHVELDLTQLAGKLPLSSVWLGPGVSTVESERQVAELLQAHDLPDVQLHRSRVPLRLEQRALAL
jgi:hypothetical protein